MPPIINVGDNSLWEHIYTTTLYAPVIPTVPPKYEPIPVFNVPTIIDRRTLAIGASSTQVKPNWRLAFFLIPSTNIAGVGKADMKSHAVFLGLNLLRLENLTSNFKLRVKVPKWHKEMNFSIWKYIGAESDT